MRPMSMPLNAGSMGAAATLAPALPMQTTLSMTSPVMTASLTSPADAAAPTANATVNAAQASEYQPQRRQIASGYQFDGNEAVKVAFFDADSTLRVSLSGSVSANGPKDVLLLPWVGAKLVELARQGYFIAIVSNQGGIPRHVSLENADKALAYAVELIRRQGGDVHYFDFAELKGDDTKPGTGMAARLERALQEKFGANVRIDKDNSLMVGDSAYKRADAKGPGDTRPDGKPGTHFSNSDRLFAENYGIRFEEPADFFGWRRWGVEVFERADEVKEFLQAHPNPNKPFRSSNFFMSGAYY